MEIQMFNGWYFFWLGISIISVLFLYFILKNKSDKTKKITLFCILAFALILHFLKFLIPPYSTNESLLLSNSWFVNICGANIALFPFIFLSKNKAAKDYMFYLGILGGFIAVLYPIEPMEKASQLAESLDIIRFYIHHTILWGIPFLMVKLKLHNISYKRIWSAPVGLLVAMLFIMLNQVLQSELGFIPLRSSNFVDINYPNPSMIWGPSGAIGDFLKIFCPSFFTYTPVGAAAGEVKYWPWFWIVFPVFILVTPVSFLLCLPFDFKNFKNDISKLFKKSNSAS